MTVLKPQPSQVLCIERLQLAQLVAPIACLDIDISAPVGSLPKGTIDYDYAWIFVTFRGHPLEIVCARLTDRVDRADLHAFLVAQPDVSALAGEAERRERSSPTGLEQTPLSTTVVICTRNRVEGLRRCLGSLLEQSVRAFDILVVDNAPDSDATRDLVVGLGSPRITYVVEPRPGLSHARNRALSFSRADILAWIDDDEIADFHWVESLLGPFRSNPVVQAVSGPMLPAELETDAQLWFEQYGGFNKHLGLTPRVLVAGRSGSRVNPLYPLPPFGTGGNMAFRRAALESIGGFDTVLGAGTACKGAEDTKALSQLLLRGGSLAYEPTAFTRHYHRTSVTELESQLHGYGTGLSAFYASMLLESPRTLLWLLRAVPSAWRDFAGPKSLRTSQLPPSFPSSIVRRNQQGLWVGGGRYVRQRLKARAGRRRNRRALP